MLFLLFLNNSSQQKSLMAQILFCFILVNSVSPAPQKANKQDQGARKADESRKRRSPDYRGRGDEEHSPRHQGGDRVRLHIWTFSMQWKQRNLF